MRYLLLVPLLAIVAASTIEATTQDQNNPLGLKDRKLPDYTSLMRAGRNEEALQVIDEMLARQPNVQLQFVLQFAKARCLQKLNKKLLALEEAMKAKKLAKRAGMSSEPVERFVNTLGLQMDRMDQF